MNEKKIEVKNLEELKDIIKEFIDFIREGNIDKGLKIFDEVISSLEYIISDEKWNESLNLLDLNKSLSLALERLYLKDYRAVADIFEYEIMLEMRDSE